MKIQLEFELCLLRDNFGKKPNLCKSSNENLILRLKLQIVLNGYDRLGDYPQKTDKRLDEFCTKKEREWNRSDLRN